MGKESSRTSKKQRSGIEKRLAKDLQVQRAQFKLGDAYQFEQEAEQDFKEAVKCYQQAADQGHAQAQFRLNQLQPP